MLSYRIAKYIGSYTAACKGLDAIAFTGGIGENAFYIRRKACSYLEHLGVMLDAHENRKNELVISSRESKVKVLVIPANEEKAMAEKLAELEK
jgi:acetate kinase